MNRFVSNFTGVDNPSAFDTAYTLLVTGGGFVSVAFLIAWSVYVYGLIALGVVVTAAFFVCALFRGANCRHERRAFPINNTQICLDCGRWRDYRIGREKQGRWMR